MDRTERNVSIYANNLFNPLEFCNLNIMRQSFFIYFIFTSNLLYDNYYNSCLIEILHDISKRKHDMKYKKHEVTRLRSVYNYRDHHGHHDHHDHHDLHVLHVLHDHRGHRDHHDHHGNRLGCHLEIHG